MCSLGSSQQTRIGNGAATIGDGSATIGSAMTSGIGGGAGDRTDVQASLLTPKPPAQGWTRNAVKAGTKQVPTGDINPFTGAPMTKTQQLYK